MTDEIDVVRGKGCLEHCKAACCYDTAMPLLPEEVERIEWVTKKKREEFTWKDGQVYRLKNTREGHCVFLDTTSKDGKKRCTIYNYRPVGCSLYPLVYDPDHDRVLVDKYCPLRKTVDLRRYPQEKTRLRNLIRRIFSI